MEQGENLNQFKKFIEAFYTNIDNKNFQQLQALIPSIESLEKLF